MKKMILFSSLRRGGVLYDFLEKYYPQIEVTLLKRSFRNFFVIMRTKYDDADLVIEAGVFRNVISRLMVKLQKPHYGGLKEYFMANPSFPIEEYERNWVAFYHIRNMDEYFDQAEGEEMLSRFWGNRYPFQRMFERLDKTRIVELACGRGRHVQKYIDSAQDITLVDVLDENIRFCQNRFKGESKIHYYSNNGQDLAELEDDSYTALFTYDAMVHFQYLDVNNYLKETYRILKRGSYALFHHSNNGNDYKAVFGAATLDRAFMSKNLFAHMAYMAGFEIVEQHVLNWEGKRNLDCVTLLYKP